MTNFKRITNEYIGLINEEINKSYRCDGLMSDKLIDAMHYSLSNGGKRIRPILMIEFCKMCGGNADAAINAAKLAADNACGNQFATIVNNLKSKLTTTEKSVANLAETVIKR